MNKKIFFCCMAVGLVMNGLHAIDNKVDLSANMQPTPEQMRRMMLDLVVYKNIISACKTAQEAKAYEKSLAQFSESLKQLIQTYAHEISVQLTDDERFVLDDLFASFKHIIETVHIAASEASVITDPQEKDRRLAKLNESLMEEYQQLLMKVAPFQIVLQEQAPSEKEIEINVLEGTRKAVSFMDALAQSFKRAKK